MLNGRKNAAEMLSATFCILSAISAFSMFGDLKSHNQASAIRDAALIASLATLAALAPGASRDLERRRLERKGKGPSIP
jgi:hypothetical protein